VKVPDERWFEENIGCENACPVNTDVPAYIAASVRGNFDKAFEINRGDTSSPLSWDGSAFTPAWKSVGGEFNLTVLYPCVS
jgi:hypothetical protein